MVAVPFAPRINTNGCRICGIVSETTMILASIVLCTLNKTGLLKTRGKLVLSQWISLQITILSPHKRCGKVINIAYMRLFGINSANTYESICKQQTDDKCKINKYYVAAMGFDINFQNHERIGCAVATSVIANMTI